MLLHIYKNESFFQVYYPAKRHETLRRQKVQVFLQVNVMESLLEPPNFSLNWGNSSFSVS